MSNSEATAPAGALKIELKLLANALKDEDPWLVSVQLHSNVPGGRNAQITALPAPSLAAARGYVEFNALAPTPGARVQAVSAKAPLVPLGTLPLPPLESPWDDDSVVLTFIGASYGSGIPAIDAQELGTALRTFETGHAVVSLTALLQRALAASGEQHTEPISAVHGSVIRELSRTQVPQEKVAAASDALVHLATKAVFTLGLSFPESARPHLEAVVQQRLALPATQRYGSPQFMDQFGRSMHTLESWYARSSLLRTPLLTRVCRYWARATTLALPADAVTSGARLQRWPAAPTSKLVEQLHLFEYALQCLCQESSQRTGTARPLARCRPLRLRSRTWACCTPRRARRTRRWWARVTLARPTQPWSTSTRASPRSCSSTG